MLAIAGLNIIEYSYLGTWVRIETIRSVRRRKLKPFAKARSYQVWQEDTNIYRTPEGIICAPSTARRIREELNSRQRRAHEG